MSLLPEPNLPEQLRDTDLYYPIAGIATETNPFLRKVLFDELVSTIPKDPVNRVLVYHGEMMPGSGAPWHLHNGPLVIMHLQGDAILQFEDREFYYKAGDVMVEPVGVIHRAYCANSEVPLAALCIQITPPDREHIVTLAVGPTDSKPLTAPPGPFMPRPDATRQLDGTQPDEE